MHRLIGACEDAEELAQIADRLRPQSIGTGKWVSADPARLEKLFRPYLEDLLPGEWTDCIVTVLFPGGTIPLHVDGPLVHDVTSTRHLLVLRSNPHAWTYHCGEWDRLEQGWIYVVDPGIPHGCVNLGPELRIHLVVDVKEVEDGEET